MVNKVFDKIGCQIARGFNLVSLVAYSDNFKFEKGIWVSVKEFSTEKNSISVYPNPAHDLVTINCQSGLNSVEFYAISGKKMDSLTFNGEKSAVYSKKFKGSGLFFIRITDFEGNISNQKIVFE